jgi:hypothetical protein
MTFTQENIIHLTIAELQNFPQKLDAFETRSAMMLIETIAYWIEDQKSRKYPIIIQFLNDMSQS